MTGADYILKFLLSQGLDTAFGIPGALNAHLYDAIHRTPAFRHVLVRHELGGAWMADGYARSTNDIGIAFTVPGPGATHAASAVAGAYTDCSRLLLISSQSETSLRGEFRRDLFHGLDQQRLFASITKWSGQAHRADDIPALLAEAVYHLRRDRPGPVQVEIPADVFGQELSAAADAGLPAFPTRVSGRPCCPHGLDEAAAALAEASRPLILAGDGVLHEAAGCELMRLAERLGAPVVTTVLGKGTVDEMHPWSLGDSNSPAGSAAYGHHDLLLAVGVRFVQVDTRWPWFFPPRNLIHLDADPREIGRVYPTRVGLKGSLRSGIQGLMERLEPDVPPSNGWAPLLGALKDRSDERADAYPLLAALQRALPTDAFLACDVCVPGFWSRRDWISRQPHRIFYPGVYVGMGFGLPCGIGAQLAHPEAAVCVIAGDGGFQMTMAELGTAVQQNLPLIVVVVNDAGLTLIRRVQDRDFGGRRCEVDLVNPHFAQLAAAYGIDSTRVESLSEVETAVRGAAQRRRLTLIEYVPVA